MIKFNFFPIFIFISTFSLASYATTIGMGVATCMPYGYDDKAVCFKNGTNETTIEKFSYIATIKHSDGSIDTINGTMPGIEPNRYILLADSQQSMRQFGIDSEELVLFYNNLPIQGCRIVLDQNSPRQKELMIYHLNSEYMCG